MVADGLTKALFNAKHSEFVNQLQMEDKGTDSTPQGLLRQSPDTVP